MSPCVCVWRLTPSTFPPTLFRTGYKLNQQRFFFVLPWWFLCWFLWRFFTPVCWLSCYQKLQPCVSLLDNFTLEGCSSYLLNCSQISFRHQVTKTLWYFVECSPCQCFNKAFSKQRGLLIPQKKTQWQKFCALRAKQTVVIVDNCCVLARLIMLQTSTVNEWL